MSYAAENLRDLLSLARLLRRFAEQHTQDNRHDLFLSAAVALEARAHMIATAQNIESHARERDVALHAPVNCLV
jgi:hypothetical protein